MGKLRTRGVMPVYMVVGLFIWLAAVAAAAVKYLPPAGGFASPEWARLIVLHVPAAMIAVMAYIVSCIYAIVLLKGNIKSDIKSAASAKLGFWFTVLATVSGMVFAKLQWGSAWNWDPRETSILLLLLVYSAYFALRSAIPNAAARAKISAVYNLLACVAMPFFVFVMPRVMGGLHPNNTLSSSGGLSTEYRVVLYSSMVGFIWLYVWLFRMQVRKAEAAIDKEVY